jgi:hypothetical protein
MRDDEGSDHVDDGDGCRGADGTLLAAVCAIPFGVVVFDAETMHIRRYLAKGLPQATADRASTPANPHPSTSTEGGLGLLSMQVSHA